MKCFFLLCILCHSYTYAQNIFSTTSNLRSKKYAVQDTISVDSLSLIPNSVSVLNVADSFYLVLPAVAKIVFKQKPKQDSVNIVYRVYPYHFAKVFAHKSINTISKAMINSFYYNYNATNANQDAGLVDFGNLDYAGSLSKGLSFGNNQDVVLNSQFNLQMNGMLADSIELLAAITDNNIPFQPEGNTQRIQEFDKIFIQLKKRKTTLLVGDHDLQKPNSYFMNFHKRVQGALFTNTSNNNKNISYKYTVGASLAKGKFVRNQLTPLEGNQGPYKLTGANGESFFIVLANSEKVYIDGALMQRGEDRDYIIDYNLGEITFMPRKMITKDLRIIVEFEFSDKNFLNSMVFSSNEISIHKKVNFHVDFFSNQDAKNQPIQQSLDSTQKLFLRNIGDSIQNALYPNVKQDTFSTNRIMYKLMDTTINGFHYDSVYVYSSNKDSAKYTVGFSYVGEGKGMYKTAASLANGRVYTWVPPVGGVLQGSYIPYVILVTPKRQQMLVVGGNVLIDSAKTLTYEAAMSNSDPNLFSSIDNGSHKGFAGKINYEEARFLSLKNNIKLQSQVGYELDQNNFKTIENVRNSEFSRDWNLPFVPVPETEKMANASTALLVGDTKKVVYQFTNYTRGNDFVGNKNIALLQWNANGWHTNFMYNNVATKGSTYVSSYTRPTVEIEKRFKFWHNFTTGSKFFVENNKIQNVQKDSLLKNAFAFTTFQLYAKNNEDANQYFSINYYTREDKLPVLNFFKRSTVSQNFSLSTALNKLKNQSLKITSTYRKLIVADTTLTAQKNDENLLGRVEYSANVLKNAINYNLIYELGAAQELKKEFTYVQVATGTGIYAWHDYNHDSIQQLNEFEMANFTDEKNFIRIFTPTNQYVKAKYNTFAQTLNINPRQFWNGKIKGIKKVISLFYFQSNLQINNKLLASPGIEQYNPFYKNTSDTVLISNLNAIVNSVYFNKYSAVWGIDFVQLKNATKSLMTYGLDYRKTNENMLKLHWNINRRIALAVQNKMGTKLFSSNFLDNRNYNIAYYSIEPTLSLLNKKNNFRWAINYKLENRQNQKAWGGELAKMNTIGTDIKYNIANSGSLQCKANFTNISFSGLSTTSIAYNMLDGLQNGKNYLWQIIYEKKLSKSVEISLNYDGRKPGNNPIVHTGRASVRALF